MPKTVQSGIQAALGAANAQVTPAIAYTQDYQPTAVRRFAGRYVNLEQEAISTSPVAALPSRPGVWISDPEEDYDLTVGRNIKEFFSMFGYAAANPLTLAAGAIQHAGDLSNPAGNANRFYFTKVYEDEDMGCTLDGLEANGFTMVGSDKYVRMTIPFFGRHVSHCQFIPTATVGPATYDGRLFARGTPLTTDAAAETFNIRCSTLGAISSVAEIETKHSSDATWSDPELVFNDRPFKVKYGETGGGSTHGQNRNDESGIELIFGVGANNSLASAGPDTWTVSTRPTIPAVVYRTGDTVFVPRNFEWTVTLDGAAFRTRPKEIRLVLNRALGNDDYGWGSDVSNSHPLRGDMSVTGQFIVEADDYQFLSAARHKTNFALLLTAAGDWIGTTAFRSKFEFSLPQIEILPFGRDMTKERTPLLTVPFRAVPSTPALLDILSVEIRNEIANLQA